MNLQSINPADLVGKSVKDVLILLEDHSYRFVCVDGKYRICTQDFRPERYNLTTVNDIVTKATMG